MFKEINVLEVDNKSAYIRVIRDSYWACRDKKGEKALVYVLGESDYRPQCNKYKSIMERVSDRIMNGKFNIVFIPTAFVPIINPYECFCNW